MTKVVGLFFYVFLTYRLPNHDILTGQGMLLSFGKAVLYASSGFVSGFIRDSFSGFQKVIDGTGNLREIIAEQETYCQNTGTADEKAIFFSQEYGKKEN